jgi:hypothetical protein
MSPKAPAPKPFDVSLSEEKRTQLGDDLARDIDAAFTARAAVIQDGGLIDLYDWFYEQGRTAEQEKPFPGAADLTSYFITENVDALRARLMKAVFGVRPFCFVEGWGQDAKNAPYVEEFEDWQVRKGSLKLDLAKTIHGALIEDGYILEVSERVDTRRITETIDVAIEPHPETGGPIFETDPAGGPPRPRLKVDAQGEPVRAQPNEPAATIERTYTKTKRLGPQYDPISMKDFVFLPGHAKSERQVWGYAYRFWERISTLQERVKDGIYDKAAVTLLGDSSDREDALTPVTADVAPQYDDAREKELFQVSLKRDLDGDGREEWYIATVSLKHRILLRLKRDDFVQRVGMSRCVPFILFPRRDSVYGYSYAGKLLTLAEEHTAVRNMKADRSALATNKPIKQLQGGIYDPDVQPFGVGRIITVRDQNELQEFDISDVPNSVIESERALASAKERVGGLADSAVGVLSGDRRTLGENRLVAGGSAVRVDEVIGHLHAAIARVMTLSHAIWIDTLKADPRGLEAPPSVTASIQQRGPDYQQFEGKFTAAQLDGDFQFEPYGSDDTADPERRKNDFDGFVVALTKLSEKLPGMAMVLQNPDVTKAVIEQLLRSYNVRDRQPFLGALNAPPPPPAAGPGGPAQMGGAPGLPPGLPPELAQILASMGGGPASGGAPAPGGMMPSAPGGMMPGGMTPGGGGGY